MIYKCKNMKKTNINKKKTDNSAKFNFCFAFST